jgi:hypothetical protein
MERTLAVLLLSAYGAILKRGATNLKHILHLHDIAHKYATRLTTPTASAPLLLAGSTRSILVSASLHAAHQAIDYQLSRSRLYAPPGWSAGALAMLFLVALVRAIAARLQRRNGCTRRRNFRLLLVNGNRQNYACRVELDDTFTTESARASQHSSLVLPHMSRSCAIAAAEDYCDNVLHKEGKSLLVVNAP